MTLQAMLHRIERNRERAGRAAMLGEIHKRITQAGLMTDPLRDIFDATLDAEMVADALENPEKT